MKFVTTKSIISVLLGTGLLSVSMFANAGSLTIDNQSTTNLSFQVEHSCSAAFGNINGKTSKVISEKNLQNACNSHTDTTEHCHVKVYDKPNCTGTHVESIELSTKDGIFLLEGGHSNGKDLAFIASAFNLTVVDHLKK